MFVFTGNAFAYEDESLCGKTLQQNRMKFSDFTEKIIVSQKKTWKFQI